MKVVSFKADPADYESWKAYARAMPASFGSLVRECLNERVFGVTPPPTPEPRDLLLERGQASPSPPPLQNIVKLGKGKCPHRIPIGTWCKACGKTK